MRPDARRFVTAAQMFTLGLAKKLFLADTFAKAAAFGYQNYRNCTTFDVIIVMLSYTPQIYFDFSSYSDMASAVSLMLNIDLPLNFNSPYKAFSVTEFWKRWHISLTDFLRTYVYFPLGGSRKGKLRTYRNIMIVFLISGFWHGANWTFVVWGLLHGAAQCFERIFKKPLSYVPKIIRWFFTFFFVNVAWLLFGASSFEQWRYLTAQTFQRRLHSESGAGGASADSGAARGFSASGIADFGQRCFYGVRDRASWRRTVYLPLYEKSAGAQVQGRETLDWL